jgi:apolipoprotein N-acyltransferase
MSENEHPAWKELRLLQDSSMKIWQMYLTWFAWFFGINVLAISWVLTNTTARGELVVSLAILMILFLLLGIGATMKFKSYCTNINLRAHELSKSIGNDRPDVHLIFGGQITRYAVQTHPIGFGLEVLAWLYVAYKFGK